MKVEGHCGMVLSKIFNALRAVHLKRGTIENYVAYLYSGLQKSMDGHYYGMKWGALKWHYFQA